MKLVSKYYLHWSKLKPLMASLSWVVMLCLISQSAPVFAQEQTAEPKLRWLEGSEQNKFRMVEKQFSDLAITMMRIGYRYNELFFAGQDENWEFAKYQTRHMKRELQNGLIRSPNRAAIAAPFIDMTVANMLKAIDKADKKGFMQSFDEMTQACNACHVAEKKSFFSVRQPTRRRSPIIYDSSK